MPIPITNPPTSLTPNAITYAVGINHAIENGKLRVAVSLDLSTANIDDNGIWTRTFTPHVNFGIEDLENYAATHPDVAPQIMIVWNAMNDLIATLNTAEGLI